MRPDHPWTGRVAVLRPQASKDLFPLLILMETRLQRPAYATFLRTRPHMDPKSARLRPICGLVRRNGFIGCDATPRAILRSRRSDRHGDALSSTRRSRAGRSSCCGAGTGSVRSLPPTQSSVRSRADATRPIRVLTSSVRSAGESVDRCFLRTAADLAGPSSALAEKARLAERRLANPVDLDREMSRPAQRGILPVGGRSSKSRGSSSLRASSVSATCAS